MSHRDVITRTLTHTKTRKRGPRASLRLERDLRALVSLERGFRELIKQDAGRSCSGSLAIAICSLVKRNLPTCCQFFFWLVDFNVVIRSVPHPFMPGRTVSMILINSRTISMVLYTFALTRPTRGELLSHWRLAQHCATAFTGVHTTVVYRGCPLFTPHCSVMALRRGRARARRRVPSVRQYHPIAVACAHAATGSRKFGGQGLV